MIRTKIVATLGPASGDVETLFRLLQAGADVFRLNFSHGTLDQHLQMLRNIRQAAIRIDRPVGVLGDLCGPKIRVGTVADTDGTGGMPIAVGDELIIQRTPIDGAGGRISSIYPALVDEVNVGDRLLIEDGLLRFVCIEKSRDELRCRTIQGGVIRSGKGINLPDSRLSVSSITERDWECIDWAIDNDLDYLALSFVRRADELRHLRQHVNNRLSDMQIVAKIEKKEAVENIDAILSESDALMVARGDLGVEMDLAQVPLIQKQLVHACQTAGKPVIVATQMLQSMIDHPTPTRAEVSDVANAIFDGADAVMLSGETSIGRHPVATVHVMSHIAQTTEQYLIAHPPPPPRIRPTTLQLSAGVAQGARQMTEELNLKLVVVYSQTGATTRVFSKFRFPVPILALSADARVLRRMTLHFGVLPMEMPVPEDLDALVESAERLVLAQKLAVEGDRIAIVAGSSLGAPGTLNGLIIHTVGNL
ncbi:MAG: pyruvate kinase [Phycisphaerae bacterium]|nr:pyruvate kinase [Phycisphaerae bacterium]MDW8263104.1 pyruvate kinase [Phycisphaerales bacterium]